MDLTKIYHDSDGNKRNILQMVKYEPEWAANVIQTHEQRIAQLETALADALFEMQNYYRDRHNSDRT